MFFFDRNKINLFEDVRENLLFAEIAYRSGSEKFKTKLFIHRGRLSSFETKKGLSRQQLIRFPEGAKVTLRFSQGPSLAEEIDKEEHGDSAE
jgi:hypothetical protein